MSELHEPTNRHNASLTGDMCTLIIRAHMLEEQSHPTDVHRVAIKALCVNQSFVHIIIMSQ